VDTEISFELDLNDGTRPGTLKLINPRGTFVLSTTCAPAMWYPLIANYGTGEHWEVTSVVHYENDSIPRVVGGVVTKGKARASRRGGKPPPDLAKVQSKKERQRILGKPKPLSNKLDFGSKNGSCERMSDTKVKTTGNVCIRGEATATDGVMEWSYQYHTGDSSRNVVLGAIRGDVASSTYNTSSHYSAIVCGTNGNVYINGRSQQTKRERQM